MNKQEFERFSFKPVNFNLSLKRLVYAAGLLVLASAQQGCRDQVLSLTNPENRLLVTITSPKDGDVVFPGDNLKIEVQASSRDGKVEEVDVFSYGALVDQVFSAVNPPMQQTTVAFSLSKLPGNIKEGKVVVIKAIAKTTNPRPAMVESSPVTLVVNDNRSPVVSLKQVSPPAAGTYYTAGEQILVFIQANDPNSGIGKLSLHVRGDFDENIAFEPGNTLVEAEHLFSFEIPYNLLNGRAEIWAEAEDSSKAVNKGESERLVLRIGSGVSDRDGPEVTFISPDPKNPQSPEPGEQVKVKVRARDKDNLVDAVGLNVTGAVPENQEENLYPDISPAEVEFSIQVPPYPSARDGDQVTLDAYATDSSRASNQGNSKQLVLRVTDKTPPQVTIVKPSGSQSVAPTQQVAVEVHAQDTNGLLDTIGISTVGALDFRDSFDLVPDSEQGDHTFNLIVPPDALCGAKITVTGVALDNAATPNQGVSAPLVLTVKDDTPPNVSITSPGDGTDVQPGARVQVETTADDINCMIDKIVLHATGAVSSDFEFDPNPDIATISHSFQVAVPLLARDADTIKLVLQAWDGGGLSSSTDPIELDINDKFPPLVNVLSVIDQDGRDILRDYGARVRPGSDLTVGVSASDVNSGIQEIGIEVLLDQTAIYTDSATFNGQTSAQHDFMFSIPGDAKEGTGVQLKITAVDSSRSANSFTRTVNLTVHEEGGPGVEILAPSFGDAFKVGETVDIKIHATDDGTGVSRINADVTGAAIYSDHADISPPGPDEERNFSFIVPSGAARDAKIFIDASALDAAQPANQGNATRVTVYVKNSPPSLTGCHITPPTPKTDDDVRCRPDGYSDPNRDPAGTFSYKWFVNGSRVTGITSDRLSGTNHFDKGDKLTCEVTPNDGQENGNPVTSPQVVVQNSPPSFSSAAITPNDPVTGDDLTCTAAGYSDPDSDALDSTLYQWFRGGVQIAGQTGQLLPSSQTWKGQSIYCRAIPNDGEDQGTPVASDPVVIGNTPPELQSAYITPDPGYETSTLTCHGQGYSDIDSDPEGYHWSWIVNGSAIVGATSSTLDGAFFDKGDQVECKATPFDGQDEGASRTSPAITIKNSPPSTPQVVITPHEPVNDDDLSCQASGSTDPDPGDSVSYEYTWYKDDVFFSNNQTVNSADTRSGETWKCEARAKDDDPTPAYSSAGSDQVLVADGIWTRLSPGGDSLTKAAYRPAVLDIVNNRLILFGGIKNASVLDSLFAMDLDVGSESWSRLSPPSSPGARRMHSMITNGVAGISFAGRLTDDNADDSVWTLDYSNDEWAQNITSGEKPPARYGHTAVYFVSQDKMVVFGGFNNSGDRLNDLYAMDDSSSSWSKVTASNPPSARAGHAAGYEPNSDCMIVFGGNDGSLKNDAWKLTLDGSGNGTWSQLAPIGDGPPTARQFAAYTMAIDPETSNPVFIIFGGQVEGGRTNDLWALEHPGGGDPSWKMIYTHGGPPLPRDGAALIFDPTGKRLILVGGRRGGTYFNDVWQFK
ncbi:MAG: hypothetical protein GXP49_03540 [Deltaproteobacteria bacterium]|nr:hypothetical protein [Deltaproteobacteria bacterium]